ncbi:MAG: carboxypeptidase regulatory-like domain-containing protein [Candidatus Rifleibacteriota bacterium]
MKKISRLAIVLFFVISVIHVGCMSTGSPARGNLSGIITDSSGNPLSGVKVATTEASTFTDVNGVWMLEALEPQMTSVSASREKYQTQTKTIEVLSGQTFEEINFVMAADSELYDIQVSSLTSTSARIVFYSKKQSIGFIRYGLNGLLNQYSEQDNEESFLHQYEITNLTPATTYRYRCVADDELGRRLESDTLNFTTEYTVRGDPPTGLKASKPSDSNSIKLEWNSDSGVDFAGYKLYKSESKDGSYVQVGSGKINNNYYTDLNVMPGRKYYYRVARLSGSGDETPKSEPVSFLMPGRMDQNAVWTAQNSPYYLTGDLTVAPGVSLVIDKGVTVGVSKGDQWDPESDSDMIDILVQGTLMIQGAVEAPVAMTSVSSSPQAGDWNGITFDTMSDLNTSIIKGLKISCVVDGVNGRAGIPEITESRFFSCKQSGIQTENAREDVNIKNNEFDTCSSAILANNNPVDVKIYDCKIQRSIYGIVSLDNANAEIKGNQIAFAGVSGIDVGNKSTSSIVSRNLIGYGSNGTGIMCRGEDEIRRNTIHSNVGIQFNATATVRIRSNLILADNTKNSIGVLYSGSDDYVVGSNQIQNNLIWDIPSGNERRYLSNDNNALPGFSTDLRLDPALMGGDPFVDLPTMDYSYVPSPGSPLMAAGYDNEDIGAFDVPRQ